MKNIDKEEDDKEEESDVKHSMEDVYQLSRTPSPVDMLEDAPMMRKSPTHSCPKQTNPEARTPTPEPTASPLELLDDEPRAPRAGEDSFPTSPLQEEQEEHVQSHSPETASSPAEDLAPLAREQSPKAAFTSRSPSPEAREQSSEASASRSPSPEELAPLAREQSPPRVVEQSPTPPIRSSSHQGPHILKTQLPGLERCPLHWWLSSPLLRQESIRLPYLLLSRTAAPQLLRGRIALTATAPPAMTRSAPPPCHQSPQKSFRHQER